MGQKVNPNGMRLGINKTWNSFWYADKKDLAKNIKEDNVIRNYILKEYKPCGISNVLIERTNDSINVSISTGKPGVLIGQKGAGVEALKKSVEKLQAKKKKFDGMIVTGAPVENMPFEEVKYWKELTEIIDFAEDHVTSTIYICWGAQAALYYQYGINKKPLPEKLFGIFETKAVVENDMLLKGMNDEFNIPHSRHTTIKREDIENLVEEIRRMDYLENVVFISFNL